MLLEEDLEPGVATLIEVPLSPVGLEYSGRFQLPPGNG